MFTRSNNYWVDLTKPAGRLSETSRPARYTIAITAILGIALRFLVSTRGHNYDFDSYKLVVAGREEGLTAWQVGRYNYGPVWAHVLYVFNWIESTIGIAFRVQVIMLLTLADVFIARYILATRNLLTACVFFLNPVSIIITGYHNQFDNLAIAVVCAALLVNHDRRRGDLDKSDLWTLLLLGLSLSTKHVFLVFMFWMAVRQVGLKRRVVYLTVPPAIFVLSFTPFLASSWSGIQKFVIGYDSADNGPLWILLGLNDGLGPIPLMALFVVALSSVGVIVRNRTSAEALFTYLVVIVITTPNLAGQYFAIAAIGAIGLGSLWFAPYVAIATYVLMLDYHGLHFSSTARFVGIIILDTPVLTEAIVRFGLIPISLLVGCAALVVRTRPTSKVLMS